MNKIISLLSVLLCVFSLALVSSCGDKAEKSKELTEEEFIAKFDELLKETNIYPTLNTDLKIELNGDSYTKQIVYKDGEYIEEVEQYDAKQVQLIDYDNMIYDSKSYENDVLDLHTMYYEVDEKFYYYVPASNFTREESSNFVDYANFVVGRYLEIENGTTCEYYLIDGKLKVVSTTVDNMDFLQREIVITKIYDVVDGDIILTYSQSDCYSYTKDYFDYKKGEGREYKFSGVFTYSKEDINLSIPA